MAAPDPVAALRAHLFDWLPRQGWFDAVSSELEDVTVVRTEVVHRDWPLVMWVPVDLVIAGEPLTTQLVVSLAPVVPDEVPDRAIIGEVPSGDGAVMAYDALADRRAVAAFAAAVVPGVGAVSAAEVVDDPWRTTVGVAADRELVVHRRLQVGPHPDVELPTAVAPDLGPAVRPPIEVWRRDAHDLVVARRRPRRAVPAAELCRRSVAELLSRRCQPRENPHDVVGELGDLGRAVAGLHVALAERFGTVEGDAAALVRVLVDRLPRRLDDAAADLVAGAYRRLAGADDLGRAVRLHGNVDLSTVEVARGAWSFTRFGGVPESDLTLDRVPLSPLADLAGVLHGLERCATAALEAALDGDVDDGHDVYVGARRRELAVLAEAWEERAADAFIAGYTSDDAVHRLLPVERISRDALLTLFELELRVRDLVRSAARPGGVLRLPLDALSDVVGAPVRARW